LLMGKNIPTKILHWHIVFVQYCNLRCSYCSTGYGQFGREKATYMKEKVWKKLTELIFNYPQKKDLVSLWIEGGETLLQFKEFFEFVQLLHKKAKEHEVQLFIKTSTNGVLIDQKILDSCAEYRIDLNFSIDGSKKIHDRFRKEKNGSPTHQIALKNWQYYKKITRNSPVACSVQSVFTGYSSLPDILDFWANQGEKMVNIVIQEPSRFINDDEEKLWEKRRQTYLKDFKKKAYELAAKNTIPGFLSDFSGPSALYHSWKDLFIGGSSSPCGAGFDTLGVDSSGDLYPCETFIGRKYWKLGNIFRGIDEKKLQQFQTGYNNSIKTCHGCDIVNLCQGGCLAAGRDREIVVNSKGGCEFMKEVIKISKNSYALMKEQL